MNIGLYLLGFLILIGGLSYGAVLMHMPTHWIVVCVVVLLGLAILKGAKNARRRDSEN